MKLKLYMLIFLFAIFLSVVVNADVYVAGYTPQGSPRQYFPPGYIINIEMDGNNCANGCDVGVRLPDDTVQYIVRNFVSPYDCLRNVPQQNIACYVDYTIPEMEGFYKLLICGPTNCNFASSQIGGGWFRVKKMPVLENLKAKDQILEERTNNLFEEIKRILQCLLSKGFVCPVDITS